MHYHLSFYDLPQLMTYQRARIFLVTLMVGVGLQQLLRYIAWKKRRQKWAQAPRDVVILHNSPRGYVAPCTGPFCMKLETYLRMARIPYENDFSEMAGPRSQVPWITINGKEVENSQICMEFLGRKFKRDFSRNYTSDQRAVARAFQVMAEEHLYWGMSLWRWVYDQGWSITRMVPIPYYLCIVFRKSVKSQAWQQGSGKLREEQVTDMMYKDLTALSYFIGKKDFLMGAEPCEADCAIFGQLSQLIWCTPGSPYESLLQGELKNLKEYCFRMREKYWPDWDRCLMPHFE